MAVYWAPAAAPQQQPWVGPDRGRWPLRRKLIGRGLSPGSDSSSLSVLGIEVMASITLLLRVNARQSACARAHHAGGFFYLRVNGPSFICPLLSFLFLSPLHRRPFLLTSLLYYLPVLAFPLPPKQPWWPWAQVNSSQRFPPPSPGQMSSAHSVFVHVLSKKTENLQKNWPLSRCSASPSSLCYHSRTESESPPSLSRTYRIFFH